MIELPAPGHHASKQDTVRLNQIGIQTGRHPQVFRRIVLELHCTVLFLPVVLLYKAILGREAFHSSHVLNSENMYGKITTHAFQNTPILAIARTGTVMMLALMM